LKAHCILYYLPNAVAAFVMANAVDNPSQLSPAQTVFLLPLGKFSPLQRKVERSDFGPNAGLVGSDIYEKQREAIILEWQLELCDHLIGDGKQGAALLEQHVSLLFDLLSLLELAQQVEDVVDRILHRNLLQTALSRQIADICL
jgi:hypothetical protein